MPTSTNPWTTERAAGAPACTASSVSPPETLWKPRIYTLLRGRNTERGQRWALPFDAVARRVLSVQIDARDHRWGPGRRDLFVGGHGPLEEDGFYSERAGSRVRRDGAERPIWLGGVH